MSRPSLASQRGFGLLSFVLVTMAVAATLVVGYSGSMTQRVANQLQETQSAQLDTALAQVEQTWVGATAAAFDSTSLANATTAQTVLQSAGVVLTNGAQARLSQVFTVPGEPISYRALVLYLPSESDGDNPPDLAAFEATGQFQPCGDMTRYCAPRAFKVFNSLEVQRALVKETALRLQRVSVKAQAYFKARMLQDPEKNIGINYWRRPYGSCEVTAQDLGCVDVYSPLVTPDPMGTLVPTRLATNLLLAGSDLVTPYGWPIEASNLEDSETAATPFSMAFRALLPNGTYLPALAVQQL